MTSSYEWAIIGAGPAGIAAVGQLIDHGINPSSILWLDPQFQVGDLGQYWRKVSSNTRVALFLNFLYSTNSFDFQQMASSFTLTNLDKEDTCLLEHIVEPLQWITQHLQTKIITARLTLHQLSLNNGFWHLETDDERFRAKNVILATGAVPRTLPLAGVQVLPFTLAIDFEQLQSAIDVHKTYGVFGSSHSAIIILRHLHLLGVNKIINFYRSPCRYAVNMGDWILFDNTGLKADTAAWAREYIDGALPNNLLRVYSNEEQLRHYLPLCDEVIYAVGFESRKNIAIIGNPEPSYNPRNGIIAPGLFGFGIAYPERKADIFGYEEWQVGMWKFMLYLKKVMPVWLRYHV